MTMRRAMSRVGLTWLLAGLAAALALLPAGTLAQQPPGTPAGVSVTRADGTLTASWGAVTGATVYHVTYSADHKQSWSLAALRHTGTSITISGVKNDATYVVGVRAGNDHGWSGWRNSPPAGPFTPPTPPPPPATPPATPTWVQLTRTSSTLAATWPAVASAIDYHVTYSADGGASWSLAAMNHVGTSITISNISNDAGYIVGVRARNAHGYSGWRNSPSAPPLNPPAVPTGLAATGGNQQITLTWNNPSNLTITRYEYQWRQATPGYGWSAWTSVPGSTRVTTAFTKTGLTNGTEYRFRLRAVNGDGPSDPAPAGSPNYVAATPQDGASIPTPPGTPPPARPAWVQVTRADGMLTATWPDDELAVTWHVTYSADGGASWSLAAFQHPRPGITIGNVSNDATYIVAVRGGNDTGYGGWRNSAPIGPLAAHPLSVSDVTSTTATLNVGNYSGTWYFKATAGPHSDCSSAQTGTSADLTGLSADTSYTYTAYEDAGCGSGALDTLTFATHLTVDNLSETAANACPIASDSRCAVAFTTGSATGGYTLVGLTATFKDKDDDNNALGDIVVTLHADNSGVPGGAVLATLSGSNPDTAGDYTYACSGPGCVLTPLTTYFAQFTSTGGATASEDYSWVTTDSDDQTSTPSGNGWSLANGTDRYGNGSWYVEYSDAGLLKVTATTNRP